MDYPPKAPELSVRNGYLHITCFRLSNDTDKHVLEVKYPTRTTQLVLDSPTHMMDMNELFGYLWCEFRTRPRVEGRNRKCSSAVTFWPIEHFVPEIIPEVEFRDFVTMRCAKFERHNGPVHYLWHYKRYAGDAGKTHITKTSSYSPPDLKAGYLSFEFSVQVICQGHLSKASYSSNLLHDKFFGYMTLHPGINITYDANRCFVQGLPNKEIALKHTAGLADTFEISHDTTDDDFKLMVVQNHPKNPYFVQFYKQELARVKDEKQNIEQVLGKTAHSERKAKQKNEQLQDSLSRLTQDYDKRQSLCQEFKGEILQLTREQEQLREELLETRHSEQMIKQENEQLMAQLELNDTMAELDNHRQAVTVTGGQVEHVYFFNQLCDIESAISVELEDHVTIVSVKQLLARKMKLDLNDIQLFSKYSSKEIENKYGNVRLKDIQLAGQSLFILPTIATFTSTSEFTINYEFDFNHLYPKDQPRLSCFVAFYESKIVQVWSQFSQNVCEENKFVYVRLRNNRLCIDMRYVPFNVEHIFFILHREATEFVHEYYENTKQGRLILKKNGSTVRIFTPPSGSQDVIYSLSRRATHCEEISRWQLIQHSVLSCVKSTKHLYNIVANYRTIFVENKYWYNSEKRKLDLAVKLDREQEVRRKQEDREDRRRIEERKREEDRRQWDELRQQEESRRSEKLRRIEERKREEDRRQWEELRHQEESRRSEKLRRGKERIRETERRRQEEHRRWKELRREEEHRQKKERRQEEESRRKENFRLEEDRRQWKIHKIEVERKRDEGLRQEETSKREVERRQDEILRQEKERSLEDERKQVVEKLRRELKERKHEKERRKEEERRQEEKNRQEEDRRREEKYSQKIEELSLGQRQEEERRRRDEHRKEEARIQKETRMRREKRIREDEKRREEGSRRWKELGRVVERMREDERRQEEERNITEERRKEEARRQEVEELKREVEKHRQEEMRRLEDERRQEDVRRQEEEQKREEERRHEINELRLLIERRQKEEERRREEELRREEERRREEEHKRYIEGLKQEVIDRDDERRREEERRYKEEHDKEMEELKIDVAKMRRDGERRREEELKQDVEDLRRWKEERKQEERRREEKHKKELECRGEEDRRHVAKEIRRLEERGQEAEKRRRDEDLRREETRKQEKESTPAGPGKIGKMLGAAAAIATELPIPI